MSILDELRDPGAEAVGLGGYVHKNDVREALLNPTDEQVWAIVKAKFPPWAQSELEADLVRAVLAAAAGGER